MMSWLAARARYSALEQRAGAVNVVITKLGTDVCHFVCPKLHPSCQHQAGFVAVVLGPSLTRGLTREEGSVNIKDVPPPTALPRVWNDAVRVLEPKPPAGCGACVRLVCYRSVSPG